MKNLLLATVFLGAFGASQADASLLTLQVFDNGTLVGSATSGTGASALSIGSDSAFSTLDLSATGSPLLPNGDLSSVTLNVSSGSITTTHTLTIDIFQTGISFHPATTLSTFTTNNLIGASGITTTESTFVNGTNSTLGTLQATHTFPSGTTNDTVGPISVPMFGPLVADAHQYVVAFTAPGESSNDTIQLTAGSAIPEPSTWVMLGLGFASFAFIGWRRKEKAPRSLVGIA